ncbi:precorrin-3B synthase, partial [Mangrovicoccus sp. HB182678]|nr:precorrin-3B synthase [Mangrovicoccus algicola]
MSARIRGWCPGALRPMAAGDGLVVRIRPPGGWLDAAQAAGLASISADLADGTLTLTLRGNLQLRGIAQARHGAVLEQLAALGLLDADPRIEARRNILVTPFADAGTDRIAAELARRLARPDAPDLPGKAGFVLDTGAHPVLSASPGDFRLERAACGTLVLRAEGLEAGAPVTEAGAAEQMVALARWFLREGGAAQGRMARLAA